MLTRAEVNQLLDTYGLAASRALGQNFVVDPSVVQTIAQLARVGSGDNVVEVGPGLGSLTLALHDTGASVLALEKDQTLIPVLRSVLESRGAADVTVVTGDAMEADWEQVLGRSRNWSLVANLPYNVAVPIVMRVLEQARAVERMLIMVQAEVANRLAAPPGGRTIGIPSIQLGWYATAQRVGTIDPDAFVPRPNVTSALIEIVRREPLSTSVTVDQMMGLVVAAYRQRRKMLRATLAKKVTAEQFDSARIASTSRPEELGVEDWVRLTEAVHHP